MDGDLHDFGAVDLADSYRPDEVVALEHLQLWCLGVSRSRQDRAYGVAAYPGRVVQAGATIADVHGPGSVGTFRGKR